MVGLSLIALGLSKSHFLIDSEQLAESSLEIDFDPLDSDIVSSISLQLIPQVSLTGEEVTSLIIIRVSL